MFTGFAPDAREGSLPTEDVFRLDGPFARETAPDTAVPDTAPGAQVTGFDPLAKECPDDLPCRVQDADLWFADTPAELEQAKAYCAECPALAICLAGAVERREPWGVWGGEIFERGAIIARKRPRGRPRKEDRDREVAA